MMVWWSGTESAARALWADLTCPFCLKPTLGRPCDSYYQVQPGVGPMWESHCSACRSRIQRHFQPDEFGDICVNAEVIQEAWPTPHAETVLELRQARDRIVQLEKEVDELTPKSKRGIDFAFR
jgi:hypothetical protein